MSVPLLLLAGIGSDAAIWAGMPEGAILAPQAASIDAMAAEALAAAPPRFALAGHSMGGYVALAIVAQAPERVERLALLSAAAAPDDEARRRARRETMAQAELDFEALAARLAHAMLHRDHRAALAPAMQAMILRVGRAAFLRQQAALLARPDRRAVLPAIEVPTLVLCGENDRIVSPAQSREMAQAIAGARFVMAPRCGHAPQLEAPQITRAALAAWLEGGR